MARVAVGNVAPSPKPRMIRATPIISKPTTADLEEKIRPGEQREDIARLRFRQWYFLSELVRCNRRVDVDAIKVREEIHQTQQTQNDICGSEQFRTHHGSR